MQDGLAGKVARALSVAPSMLLGILPVAVAAAAVAEPIARSSGAEVMASTVRWALSPLCHQATTRSLLVAGAPMALCARCLAIYAAFGLVAWGVSLIGRRCTRLEIPMWVVVAGTAPLAIDSLSQLFELRQSSAPLRIVTGILMGASAALYVATSVERAAVEAKKKWRTPSDAVNT